MIPRVWAFLGAFVLSAGFFLVAEKAQADDVERISSEINELRVQAEALRARYLRTKEYKGSQYVAERLIDGENFYRIKDYQRAAIIFMDIIENYPGTAAYGDALYLYADSLFLSRDYLGARDWFRRVVEEKGISGTARFRQKAIERLIEIAIHLGDFQGIDAYFVQLGRTPTPEAQYVKGRYYYFRGDLDQARQHFEAVSGDPLITLKAVYMQGVILTRQDKYEQAIEQFLRGRSFEPKTNEEREIVDLLNLGAGRLYFEKGFVQHASECYQRIQNNSPFFDAALYEAATVLIQAGDTIRAEQTLEVLTVAVPDSKYIPRAKMLRGNLLLRAGRYDEAEKVFDELIGDFTPVMKQLDLVIEQQQQDTRQFFVDLVERSMTTLDVSGALPALVVRWVSEERDVQRALELANDLGTTKEYVRETERLVSLLEAVIDGPSLINAIPMLRDAQRKAQQIENRIGQLRVKLMSIAEKKGEHSSGEFAALKQERQALEKKLRQLPTTDAEYKLRENESRKIYDRMRKELSRNIIRIDQLTAMVVAIEKFITDPRYVEGATEESVQAVVEELERHKASINSMREEVLIVQRDVDAARYQVGVGDIVDREDAELKKQIRELAQKERNLLRSQGGETGIRLERAYASADSVELLISSFSEEVNREAHRQIETMQRQVHSEKDRVVNYQSELRLLRDEAEEVVGGVAFENFSNVRKRFYDLILKADVGIIDVAWLRKEEHTTRINELTKGRLNEIRTLDDEFQEVRSGTENQAR